MLHAEVVKNKESDRNLQLEKNGNCYVTNFTQMLPVLRGLKLVKVAKKQCVKIQMKAIEQYRLVPQV